MSRPSPAHYRTTNWSSYTASLRKRGLLLIWLDKNMTWLASHDGSPGRPVVFSDAAIQFCLTIKVLFKLPGIAQGDDPCAVLAQLAPQAGDDADTGMTLFGRAALAKRQHPRIAGGKAAVGQSCTARLDIAVLHAPGCERLPEAG